MVFLKSFRPLLTTEGEQQEQQQHEHVAENAEASFVVPPLSAVLGAPEGEKTESGVRIKTLPPSVVKDIEQKNVARRLAGLSPLSIRVRRCLTCGSLFESSGNRTCGCSNRSAGIIAGREII